MKKVSIITVAYNSAKTIRYTIESIQAQDYPQIEHIVIDGASTDGTVDIVKSYERQIAKLISEPDRGIYDAMNKGIRLATGDIIGILNSDDFYASTDIISTIVNHMEGTGVDLTFGDLVYVASNNLDKVIRYYSSTHFRPDLISCGCVPPHPTVFVKSWAYKKYGYFKTNYKIAGDYELLTRFLAKYQLSYQHIPCVMVKMRAGGASTKNILSMILNNREIVRACNENDVPTNILKILSKYTTKIFQLVHKPDETSISRFTDVGCLERKEQ